MWIGSLPLENCIPGNAPWLDSVDAIVVGCLSLCGLGRAFRGNSLLVSPAIATGADLSGVAGTGASAGVTVSAAATGTAGAGDAAGTHREAAAVVSGAGAATTAGTAAVATGAGESGAAGTDREAAAVVSGAGAGTSAGAAAVATATGGGGATTTAGATGEAIPAGAPDSIVTGGRLLATGAGDDSADGIGSEFLLGSTRTPDAWGASAPGEAIIAGGPDSIGIAGAPLATGAGDGCADGIGSELVVGSTRTSAGWEASGAGEGAASGAMGGSEAGGAVAVTGAVSTGMDGAGCVVAPGGAV